MLILFTCSPLAQVAAHADQHIRVAKATTPEGRRVTCFDPLGTDIERVLEIAEMMGAGEGVAAQMLAQAAQQEA